MPTLPCPSVRGYSISIRVWSDCPDDDMRAKEKANKFVERQLKEQSEGLVEQLKKWAAEFDCQEPCECEVIGPVEKPRAVTMRPLPHDKVQYDGTYDVDVSVVCDEPDEEDGPET